MADGGSSDGLTPAAVLALLTPVLAGLAALTATGSLGGIQRNSTTLFILALVFVVLAGGLWILGEFVSKERYTHARIPSLALGVSGAWVALGALVAYFVVHGTIARWATVGSMTALALALFGFALFSRGQLERTSPATTVRQSGRGRLVVRVSAQDFVRLVSLATAVAGVMLAFAAAVHAASADPRPSITASLSPDSPVVTGTVQAANLASDDEVIVYIDGIKDPFSAKPPGVRLTRATVGPDADGKVDVQVQARFQPGRFTHIILRAFTEHTDNSACSNGTKGLSVGERTAPGAACFILPLPPQPKRPGLTLGWSQGTQSLHVAVEATNAARRVALTILARRQKKTAPIYRSVVGPDENGHLKEDFDLRAPRGGQLVCAAAEFIRYGELAPVRKQCPSARAKPFGVATARIRLSS
jgi:hypothetical protein